MPETKPKRFYTNVETTEDTDHHVVKLDGRVAKTPGRQPLGANNRDLAAAIAAEWDAQEEFIDLAGMPLTRLQGFALDGGARGRAEWAGTILSYARSDLLCYRADDPVLATRQARLWQPVLDAVGARYGASFVVTEGIVAVRQPDVLITGLGRRLAEISAGQLFAVELMTEITGSAALAFAVLDGVLSAEDAFAASRLDETYQAETWGTDTEAAAREAALGEEFAQVVRFLELSS